MIQYLKFLQFPLLITTDFQFHLLTYGLWLEIWYDIRKKASLILRNTKKNMRFIHVSFDIIHFAGLVHMHSFTRKRQGFEANSSA